MAGNFLSDKELIVLLGPTTSSTATSTSAVVDMSNCDGVHFVCGAGDKGAAVAFSVITGSTSDASGSTVGSISTSTADHAVQFTLHKPTVRYAKVTMNPGAGAVDGGHVYAFKYGVTKHPVSQGSTSVAGSTLLVGSS